MPRVGEPQPDFKPLTVGDRHCVSLPKPYTPGFPPPEQGALSPPRQPPFWPGLYVQLGLALLHHMGRTSWLASQRGAKSSRTPCC